MIDISKFWEIVKLANWGVASKSKDWKSGKMTVQRTLRRELTTVEDLKSFQETFYVLKNKLGRTITQFERKNAEQCGTGDDSFGDLCCHIVGLGQEVYEAELAAPLLAVRRAQRGDYVESFGYCIPDENLYSLEGQIAAEKNRLRDKILRNLEKELGEQILATMNKYGELADIENGWLEHAVSSASRTALVQFVQRKPQG